MQTLTEKNYSRLVNDLNQMVTSAQAQAKSALHEIRLKTYWNMGKRIHAAKKNFKPSESSAFLQTLADDLQINRTTLYQITLFYKTYAKKLPTKEQLQLSWNHHIQVLTLSDSKERLFYLKQARLNNWSRRDLKKAIQKNAFEKQNEALDSPNTNTKLKRDQTPLYTYKAQVERVIDGDTLLVKIDLGFHTFSEQRLRLRGINAKELTSKNPAAKQRALAAKEFVTKRLEGLDFIVLKSYKTDKYGRFVADVFYHHTHKDRTLVAQKGHFLNQDLISQGLADVYE